MASRVQTKKDSALESKADRCNYFLRKTELDDDSSSNNFSVPIAHGGKESRNKSCNNKKVGIVADVAS